MYMYIFVVETFSQFKMMTLDFDGRFTDIFQYNHCY